MGYVLVVDDNEPTLAFLRALLTGHGIALECARNGVEALAEARRTPPLLVLSDLLMPIMDGYTLLRHWKVDGALNTIPFVVYTATYTDLDDERLALDLGADAFIQKFIEPSDLVARLKQVIADSANHGASLPAVVSFEESVHLKYSEALVRKLESKTLQLHASNRVLQSEIRWRRETTSTQVAILDALDAKVALIDSVGVILTVNRAWRRDADINQPSDADAGVGQNYLELCDAGQYPFASEAKLVAAGIRGVLSGEAPHFNIEYPCHPPARQRWFRMTVTPFRSEGLSGAVVMHVEITDVKSAEQRLADSEAQYLLLLNSTAEGIYRLDINGICTFCNPTAARLLGYSDPRQIVGQSVHEHHHHSRPDGTPYPLEECKVYQAVRTGNGSHADDEVFVRADGSQFPVEYWSYPILRGADILGTVVTFLDITVRRNLEAAFLQAQKMEAVGRLAGGVAHDFNNALQVILTYGELLDERLTSDELGRQHNLQIVAAGHRAASLTRQLLAFSRKQVLRPTLLELGSVVGDIEEMLRRTIGEHISFAVNCDSASTVLADRGQVEQVVINLVINAGDAMPDGGEILITTSDVRVGPQSVEHGEFVEAGDYVILSVRDTGAGMSESVRSRIFEPFFTTKEAGKGTGLGLSTVYGIVKQSNGYITVDSEVGRGTNFNVYFPIAAGTPEEHVEIRKSGRPAGGTETILLVEDETSLRSVVGDTLRSHGYTVLEAHDGTSGIDLANRVEAPIALLLTDVVLPGGGGGRHVAGELMSSRPAMKVIYMSGYADEFIAHHANIDPETVLLEKPFSTSVLLNRIRAALDPAMASR